jgi:hypothetical protein
MTQPPGTGDRQISQLVALPDKPRVWTESEVVEAFTRKGKCVVTFLGFGELGYENIAKVRAIAEQELRQHAPHTTLVNTGTLITVGFQRGIADVYHIAKRLGFSTTGIHPSVALTSPKVHALSPFVDEVFFVCDDTWGGVLEHTATLSPTLRTLITVSHEVIAIGGGKYTQEEIQACLTHKKPVRFYAAEMHHATSRDWARTSGVELGDFHGAAYHAWKAADTKDGMASVCRQP